MSQISQTTARKRSERSTYVGDLVEAEFLRLKAFADADPTYTIMPKDIAKNTGLHDGTVRRILRERDLWTVELRNRAKVETLKRINASKAANGYPSLRRQAEQGWPNLRSGRARLAEMHRLEATEQEAVD